MSREQKRQGPGSVSVSVGTLALALCVVLVVSGLVFEGVVRAANPSQILPIVYMRGGGEYLTYALGVSPTVAGGLAEQSATGSAPRVSVDGTVVAGAFVYYRTDPGSYLTETVCGVAAMPPSGFVGDGIYHTVSWGSGTTDGGEYHSLWVTGGSYQVRFPVALSNESVSPEAYGMLGPLTVGVTGEANPAVGVHYTYTATITGGSSPFSTEWMVSDQTDKVIYTGSYGIATTLSFAFDAVETYTVTCTVTDSLGTVAIGQFTVHLLLNKPVLWAQVRDDGGMWFSLYDDSVYHLVLPVSESLAITTNHYNIVDPETNVKAEQRYKLWVAVPLPNPLVVSVLYVDPLTGVGWHYSFSFDTTGWATGSSAGSGGEGGPVATPSWLTGLDIWLGKVLAWLFVPDGADVVKLFSSIVDETAFNPFHGVTLPTPEGSLMLLRHEDLGTTQDVSITVVDNTVFVFIRLAFKFAICFGCVMMVLGAV